MPLLTVAGAFAVYVELAVKQPLVTKIDAQSQAQTQVLQTQLALITSKLDEVPRIAGNKERLNQVFSVLLQKQEQK
jgi:hypothetical protein